MVGVVSARDAMPQPTARDLAEQHDMRIHRAKQRCRPILHAGTKKFIAGFCWHKGDDEMVVYLEGVPGKVRPCEVTIIEEAT